MKKLLFIMLLVINSFIMAQATISFLGSPIAGDPGKIVTVPVTVSGFSNVAAITIRIEFNTSIVSFVDAVNWNSQLPGALAGMRDGGLMIAWDGTSPANINNGTLVELRFMYNGGETPLKFILAQCELTDIDLNPISVTYTNGTLNPVELSCFTAAANGKSVSLRWETATEVNNSGFDVERHLHTPALSGHPSQEGINWEKIGFVPGHGNSNSPQSYIFTDNNISFSGKYSYRLKQIDINGVYEYLPAADAEVTLPGELMLEQNYPNPFNPNTSISFILPTAGHVKLNVFNTLGQMVNTMIDEYKEAGRYNVKINAANWISGIYIYKLETGSQSLIRKMTMIK